MRILSQYFSIVLLCILSTVIVHAKPQVNISATPAWVIARTPDLEKKPKAKEISNGSYLSLYDEQVNVVEKTRYTHILRNIMNEAGVQANSELSFSFIADYQQIYFHKITIHRDGAQISKLDRSQIRLINSESSLYLHQLSGNYNALLILDDLRKGDVLELAYSVKGENPVYNNKYTDRFAFANTQPITNHYTSVLVQAGKTINYKCYNSAPAPKIIRTGNYSVYDWPVMQLQAYDFGESTPSWYTSYPHVEVSEFNTWDEVNSWALWVMNNYNYPLSPAIKQKIEQWENETSNPAAFAEKATRFVQDDVRYTGIEIGVNSHKPHPPAETFAKRYGDCKDKSLLLVTMLRSQGIDAHMALVSTTLRDHVEEHLPSPSLFDHAIVKAVINDKIFFIDATSSMQRGSISDIQLPNYAVAFVIKNGGGVEAIPLQSTTETEIIETLTVPKDNDSVARLQVKTTYKGSAADNLRSFFSETSMKDIEDYYENFYKNNYSSIKLVDSIEYNDNFTDNIVTTVEYYNIDSVWQKSGKDEYVGMQARSLYQSIVEPDEDDMQKPLAQSYPVNIKYTAIYEMPSEWSFTDKGVNISTSAYSFNFTPTVVGRKVILEYHYTTYRDHLLPAELEQYKKDYKKMVGVLEYNMTANKELLNKIESIQSKNIAGRINWIAVFVFALCFAGMFFFLRKVNRNEIEQLYAAEPEKMNWWLVLLGVVLGLRIIIYLSGLYSGGYFLTTSWITMNELGATGMQLLLMIEMASFTCFAIYAGWLLYWHVNRRSIFPRMFIIFAFAELGFNVVEVVAGLVFKSEISSVMPNFLAQAAKAVFNSAVFCAIWVTPMFVSYKVRDVFTRPYKLPDEPTEEEQPFTPAVVPVVDEQNSEAQE